MHVACALCSAEQPSTWGQPVFASPSSLCLLVASSLCCLLPLLLACVASPSSLLLPLLQAAMQQSASYKLQVTSHKLQVTSYKLRVKPKLRSYKLQATGRAAHLPHARAALARQLVPLQRRRGRPRRQRVRDIRAGALPHARRPADGRLIHRTPAAD